MVPDILRLVIRRHPHLDDDDAGGEDGGGGDGGDDGGGGDDEDVLQKFCQKSWYIMYCRVKAKHLCWKAFMKWIPLKTKPPGKIGGKVLDGVSVVRVAGVGGEAASALQEPSLSLPGGHLVGANFQTLKPDENSL